MIRDPITNILKLKLAALKADFCHSPKCKGGIGPHLTTECPWTLKPVEEFHPVNHHLEKRKGDVILRRRFS